MTVKVLLFGTTADAVGSRELELAGDHETTTKSLVNQLSQRYPALSSHKLLIAVNEEYVDADTILKDGDEIAIFTAVSGG